VDKLSAFIKIFPVYYREKVKKGFLAFIGPIVHQSYCGLSSYKQIR